MKKLCLFLVCIFVCGQVQARERTKLVFVNGVVVIVKEEVKIKERKNEKVQQVKKEIITYKKTESKTVVEKKTWKKTVRQTSFQKKKPDCDFRIKDLQMNKNKHKHCKFDPKKSKNETVVVLDFKNGVVVLKQKEKKIHYPEKRKIYPCRDSRNHDRREVVVVPPPPPQRRGWQFKPIEAQKSCVGPCWSYRF